MNAGPSRTAEYMALFRALESARRPAHQRLFDDPQATRFLRPSLRALARAARFQPAGSLIRSYIDRRWPGPRASGAVRTRMIDDFVNEALSSDCTQLVLLGAGYDTRATRLRAAQSCAAFEVDHPLTQARKRAALGASAGAVSYVPVDFERDVLPRALIDAGFESDRPACVLWEGVFSYLSAEAIDATLAALVQVCANGSQVLLTYVDERALDASDRGSNAWVTAVEDAGESFKTGLDPRQAGTFFAARGLRLDGDESTADAADHLGVAEAGAIPAFYRLAMLTVVGGDAGRGVEAGSRAAASPGAETAPG